MVEEKKKKSIHDTGGGITTQYTMAEIEAAHHPRATEKVKQELEELVSQFADAHRDAETGTIKDPDKAADEFIEMFAKYHFGSAFETIKEDKKQMARILEETYGITRRDLKRAFQRKGAYATRSAVFEQHVNPLVERVASKKQEEARTSLNFYLNDGETRPQVEEHIQKRTGRKIRRGHFVDLTDAVNVIGSYMALPGSEDAIDKPEKQLQLPDEVVGQPSLYKIFEGGEEAHKIYKAVPEKVDTTHRFAGKKYKKKPAA